MFRKNDLVEYKVSLMNWPDKQGLGRIVGFRRSPLAEEWRYSIRTVSGDLEAGILLNRRPENLRRHNVS